MARDSTPADSKSEQSEKESDGQRLPASGEQNQKLETKFERPQGGGLSKMSRRGALSVLGGAALLGATGTVSARSNNHGHGNHGHGHGHGHGNHDHGHDNHDHGHDNHDHGHDNHDHGHGNHGHGEYDGGKSLRTEPPTPPYVRARAAGFDIQNIVPVTKTSQITGAAHTMYVVDGDNGPLTWDGRIQLNGVNDTAICGKNGASLKIPAGYRSYAVKTEQGYSNGGTGFLWSGIDIDQTAEGAYGRIDAHVDDKGIVEYMKTIGQGRPANPDPSSSLDSRGIKSGAALYPAAQTTNGTSIVRNVEMIHGGVLASRHFGDRPFGIFMASRHTGTLRLQRTRIEEFPNNALYASNVPGSTIAENCRFYNNGVSNGRISHGAFINCTIGYDYKNTGMANANAPGHGLVGIAIEQKKAGLTNGPYPIIYGCTIEMKNVGKCGGAIRTYTIHAPSHVKEISNCDTHIGNTNATLAEPDAPDMDIGGICDSISNTVMSGSADGGTSINNGGPSIGIHDLTFDYPAGRKKKVGKFHYV